MGIKCIPTYVLYDLGDHGVGVLCLVAIRQAVRCVAARPCRLGPRAVRLSRAPPRQVEPRRENDLERGGGGGGSWAQGRI